jgi:hypothetical protein
LRDIDSFENRVLRKIFGRKREEDGSWGKLHKKALGRPRHKWKDNIKIDLRWIGIDGVNWIHLAQDRFQWRAFVNTVMNLRVP